MVAHRIGLGPRRRSVKVGVEMRLRVEVKAILAAKGLTEAAAVDVQNL